MIKNSFRVLMGAAVFIAIALTVGAGRAQVDLKAFVQTGDPAPGTPPGTLFRFAVNPVINAAGEVAFRGFLTGPGVNSSNDEGIWGPDASGALSLLARTGDQAPGAPLGVVFGEFRNPVGSEVNLVINAAGEVAFFAILSGPDVASFNNSGIWGPDASGNLSLLAREGETAPGTGAVFAGFAFDTVINAAGEVAFRASLRGPGVDLTNIVGVWGPDGSGTLSLLARTGDPAPGTGAVFGPFDNGLSVLTFSEPVIGGAGEVAFRGALVGPGVDTTNNTGIWGPDASGNLSLLARGGDWAPGKQEGTLFGGVGAPVINAAGELAFGGSLTGPDVAFPNNRGIWGPDASGNLSLLVRGGDPAPGTTADVVFRSFGAPLIDAAGEVAFRAFLFGPDVTALNDFGIWGPDASGNLSLLARRGDQAPGTPEGVVFGGPSFVINGPGDVAIFSDLTGPDVTALNNFGVWGPDASGNLTLLARKGDVIELSPGTSLPLTFVSLFGLSDNGQAGLLASFPGAPAAILLSNPNAPPVADAGPDRTVECTGPDGASVMLDGSGSSDPDGDSLSYAWSGSFGTVDGETPTVNLSLGAHLVTLVVNDGQVDSEPGKATVTVADRTPPGLVASLTPVGEGDDHGDSDEGRFRIDFSAADTCDPAPGVAAVLAVPGIADIPVDDGQVIEFEMEDEETEVESEDGILEIEAPGLALKVTGTDASGNAATAAVQPAGLGGDNDDDTVASADEDD